ncbi:27-O-demethylrifamycin SV methyltransferase [Palleronia abyssalis]|uniref:27-O-demethylrifamycin SV methyltransferase n=1 Tax=Palleronia abyssalis TaxID=1501240 RepID=A0A2R8BXX4_9RHOB|nr:27-O-demethylrifamycin SV methyltransferase [Palleronia abyssalis]
MLQSSRFWNRHGASYSRRSAPDDEAYRRTLALTQDYLPTGAGVPELGCGTGTTAIHHAPHAVHITTGDVSVGMLQIARDRAANAGAKNVSFVEAEAAAYNAAGRQFDAVLALSLLHLMPDWRGMVHRIHGMMKLGGVFVSSTVILGSSPPVLLAAVSPLGRKLGVLPALAAFKAHQLRAEIHDAGFTLEEDWKPKKDPALFLIARSPASRRKTQNAPAVLGPGRLMPRRAKSQPRSSTIWTRCGILLTMPRIEGVSSSSRVRCILFSPRPTRIWRWTLGRRMGEPTCLTTIVLAMVYASSATWVEASGCSSRLGRMSATFLPRRWATERGLA